MKIQETAKNGVKINIDTPMEGIFPNGLIIKPKEHIVMYKDSPSRTSKLVDNNFENNYHEMDRLAENWIDLLLSGILKNHNDRYN